MIRIAKNLNHDEVLTRLIGSRSKDFPKVKTLITYKRVGRRVYKTLKLFKTERLNRRLDSVVNLYHAMYSLRAGFIRLEEGIGRVVRNSLLRWLSIK